MLRAYDGDTAFWKERLHYLLDHADAFDDAEELFTAEESESVIRSIAEIKVIDPAVGSGAFPMAILHKLTLALRRLDRHNWLWESLQKEIAGDRARSAFDTTNQDERDAELKEISDTFEKYRRSDFGRKLYLIQNSIFGVDIQPIACQIAKLRFFISLAIEQNRDLDAANFGIKASTEIWRRGFVAADTLLGLQSQQSLNSERARHLEQQLHANRQRHFHATTRRRKLALSDMSKELRAELSTELQLIGMPASDAARIANWDPYDQNGSANWFNTGYMFGVSDGFDIVIGNPPYIQLQRSGGKLADRYMSAGYTTFVRSGDIYVLFYEKGCQLLSSNRGLLAYITSNSWLRARYGRTLRRLLSEEHTPLLLLEMGKDVFDAIVDTNILVLHAGGENGPFKAIDIEAQDVEGFPPQAKLWGRVRTDGQHPWRVLSLTEESVLDKVTATGVPLRQWDVRINRGITTGYNAAFIIDTKTKDILTNEDRRSAEIIKPILRGRDIQRYQAEWAGLWLIFSSARIAEDDFPAVRGHLLPHKQRLLKRKGGADPRTGQVPYEWWQLQVDYYKSGTYKDSPRRNHSGWIITNR